MSGPVPFDGSDPQDTAHYPACKTLQQKLQKLHNIRCWVTIFCCVLNGYFHIIPMPMMRNAEELPIWVRNGIWGMGFVWAVLGFFMMFAIGILGFLATPEKRRLNGILAALLVICFLCDLVLPLLGIPMLALTVWELAVGRKAIWLAGQPGYPYFSERFAEQLKKVGKPYESRYDLTSAIDDMMCALDENREQDPFNSEPAQKPLPEGIAGADIPFVEQAPPRPTALTGVEAPVVAAITELPGTPATPEPEPPPEPRRKKKPAPPEPEPVPDISVPSGSDIPDPVWDVPDPVLDTGTILSDFPEINGDIPDLPDIPDIPTL